MFVVTIDQIGSRRVGDLVEPFLGDLRSLAPAAGEGLVRGFERTVGDEVQGVLDNSDAVVDLALRVLRRGGWTVGIGCGDVDEPLPASTRAGSGRAFVHARDAVEAAKSRTRPAALAVRGPDADAAADADAVLVLLAAVAARRTPAGWAVVDAMRTDPRQRQEQVAADLGITQQAVSQRLRAALWSEELATRPAASRLLRLACGGGTGPPGSL